MYLRGSLNGEESKELLNYLNLMDLFPDYDSLTFYRLVKIMEKYLVQLRAE